MNQSFTWDELVEFGKRTGAECNNGLPWSFSVYGIPVTHENDNTYIICNGGVTTGSEHFHRGDRLIVIPPQACIIQGGADKPLPKDVGAQFKAIELLKDLLYQVTTFVAKHGEADFEVGEAVQFLKTIGELSPNAARIYQQAGSRYGGTPGTATFASDSPPQAVMQSHAEAVAKKRWVYPMRDTYEGDAEYAHRCKQEYAQWLEAHGLPDIVAWAHDGEGRVDVCHAFIKQLLVNAGCAKQVEHYTIPLTKADLTPRAMPAPVDNEVDFANAWGEMQRRGYQYGPSALEHVHTGFMLARGVVTPAARKAATMGGDISVTIHHSGGVAGGGGSGGSNHAASAPQYDFTDTQMIDWLAAHHSHIVTWRLKNTRSSRVDQKPQWMVKYDGDAWGDWHDTYRGAVSAAMKVFRD